MFKRVNNICEMLRRAATHQTTLRKIGYRLLMVACLSVSVGKIALAADPVEHPDPSRVLAMVGSYRITQGDVDARIFQSYGAERLYDMRKNAMDSMIDEYLIKQAAQQAKIGPDEYMKLKTNVAPVTESDARAYYDQHKARIDAQTGNKPFDQIKSILIPALQKKNQQDKVAEVITNLRAEQDIKIALTAPHFQVNTVGSPSLGPKEAPVEIAEFADFQCPYCKGAETALGQVRNKYGSKVRLVYMDFPLSFHSHSLEASMAARCAGEQDKFWPYHDVLFADQSKLDPGSLKTDAAKIGLDTKRFNTCFDSKKYQTAVISDRDQGMKLGLTGTPTFFLNGHELSGAQSAPTLSSVIDEELKAPTAPVKEAAAR
jgi:protein-disulfide isomerase